MTTLGRDGDKNNVSDKILDSICNLYMFNFPYNMFLINILFMSEHHESSYFFDSH